MTDRTPEEKKQFLIDFLEGQLARLKVQKEGLTNVSIDQTMPFERDGDCFIPTGGVKVNIRYQYAPRLEHRVSAPSAVRYACDDCRPSHPCEAHGCICGDLGCTKFALGAV